MRDFLVKNATAPAVVAGGMLLLLIFIAAMKVPQQNKAYTYLALGDSYTIGEQVKPEENFPNQATALLRRMGFDFKDPVIVARTGWTTDELEQGINKETLEQRYDFVTLLIGVNNQYRGRTVHEYSLHFDHLLQRAIGFAGNDPSRVIVLSIPDWSVTPYAKALDRALVAAQIDAYNVANEQIAAKHKVTYINITGGTREAADDLSLLAGDSLHPSGKEYGRWSMQVAEKIQAVL